MFRSGRHRRCLLIAAAVLGLVGSLLVAYALWPTTPRVDQIRVTPSERQQHSSDPFAGVKGIYFGTDDEGRVVITEAGRAAIIANCRRTYDDRPSAAEIYSDDPQVRLRAYEQRMERVRKAFEDSVQGTTPEGAIIIPQTKVLPPEPVPPACFPGPQIETPEGES